jgi:CHASE1-domain containing sensor protein
MTGRQTLNAAPLQAERPGKGSASLPGFFVPLMIGAAIAGASLWTSHMLEKSEIDRMQSRFSGLAQTVERSIESRMSAYEQVLKGGVALFNVREDVSREDWRTYVNTLEIDENYPGIQGNGYSEVVRPTERAAHIARIRAQGFPAYTIKPPGTRDIYTAIVFLEPFDLRNRQAFGYDMMSQETRREAMTRATETGKAAMSGRVTLVQEIDSDVQAGFLTYLPVFRKRMPTDSIDERRVALKGFVYSPFRMKDLMQGLLGGENLQLALSLYDTAEMSRDTLMYCTGAHRADAQVSRTVAIQIAGRRWTLRLSSLPPFERRFDMSMARIVLVSGLIIAGLMTVLTWLMQNMQRRALE